MESALRPDQASFVRHLALVVATVIAWALRFELRVGNRLLWIIATAALLNMAISFLSRGPRAGMLAARLSALVGLSCWTALVFLTGGAGSPYVLGYGLEIVLSGLTFSARGTALVAIGAVGALWGQQAFLSMQGAIPELSLGSAVILITGMSMILLARRWSGAREELSRRHAALRERLERLEEELVEVKRVGEVGENVARLAHGLKNAVSSLRGFGRLLEREMAERPQAPDALEGLRVSIDQVECLARLILDPAAPVPEERPPPTCANPARVIEEVAREASGAWPGLRCMSLHGVPLPSLAFPEDRLREVLQVLLRNAAEAMGNQGRVIVQTECEEGAVRILVRDQGPGISREALARMMKPGYTTKPNGSGFGLFLARRVVEAYGGSLKIVTSSGAGAELCLTLRPA